MLVLAVYCHIWCNCFDWNQDKNQGKRVVFVFISDKLNRIAATMSIFCDEMTPVAGTKLLCKAFNASSDLQWNCPTFYWRLQKRVVFDKKPPFLKSKSGRRKYPQPYSNTHSPQEICWLRFWEVVRVISMWALGVEWEKGISLSGLQRCLNW